MKNSSLFIALFLCLSINQSFSAHSKCISPSSVRDLLYKLRDGAYDFFCKKVIKMGSLTEQAEAADQQDQKTVYTKEKLEAMGYKIGQEHLIATACDIITLQELFSGDYNHLNPDYTLPKQSTPYRPKML